MEQPINILTVDLEEWFVVEALAGRVNFSDWSQLDSTVVENSRRLLDLFHLHSVRSTWFVLGWVVDRYPELIQEIGNQGHEIACHSYYHRRVDKMDRDTFKADTEKVLEAIVRATGRRALGYRAPSWSINAKCFWAWEVLGELGFEYDSSIFPIKHDIYGIPGGPRRTFKLNLDNGKTLYEIPATTFRFFGKNVPIAGGGFLRHSPYWYSQRIIKKLNMTGQPAMVYVHPWEFDPNPPLVENLSVLQRYRTYGSTSIFYHKLGRLLTDFEFSALEDHIGQQKKRRIGFHAR